MVYKVADIIRDVRIAMDTNDIDASLLADKDTDTLQLDDIIRSVIVDAVKTIEIIAPAQLVDSGHNFGDQIYWMNNGSGQVLLPLDFMRLVVFKMSDWERPVYTAIMETSDKYALQHSRFKGVRGNTQKPVCAIVKKPEGNVLEFFACNNESATITQAVYLPFPYIDGEDGIEISERCYKAVVYQATAFALSLLNDNRTSTFVELAKSVLV